MKNVVLNFGERKPLLRITHYALRNKILNTVAALYPASSTTGAARRILLIRPDHLGDVLFLTPALRLLRRARPDLEITVLVGPWARPLLANNPDIDALETMAFPWFDRKPRRSLLAPYRRLFEAAARLRGRFDTAVIMRFDHWWAGWLTAQAGIPHRIGYATSPLASFLTEAVPYTPGKHEALQNLTLLARLGAPATMTPDEAPLVLPLSKEATAAAEVLSPPGMPAGPGPLVAIHPGSGAPVKRWRPAAWGEFADALRERFGARFVITGSPDERGLAHAVAAQTTAPVEVVAGRTDLLALAALYARCDLVVGPDAGPLHLAVAVGTPTVHLYGPVNSATFGPWGPLDRHRVLVRGLECQFCDRLDWPEAVLPDHPCVSGFSPAVVIAAATRLLNAGGRFGIKAVQ